MKRREPRREEQHLITPVVGVVLVLVFAAWGAQQAAIKIGNGEMAPVFQAGLRSIGATALLTVWSVFAGQPPWKMGLKVWEIIALGVLFTLDFGLLYLGLDLTSASRGTILYYTGPLMMALGAFVLVPGERVGRVGVLGLVIAFAGTGLILGRAGFAGTASLAGDALCLAGAAAWAATILLIKSTSLVSVPASAALYFQLAGSAVLLPALSLLIGESWDVPKTPAPLAALAFQIVVVAFASYLVFFRLLKTYPLSTLSAWTFLVPVFGIATSAAILNEPISTPFFAGAAMVITGLALVTRR